MQWFLPDERATLDAGFALGQCMQEAGLHEGAGFHVRLEGDLGAGKTTLVRGVLRGLGYTGRVKSPTYPLLETYRVGALSLAHFDLYRLESPEAFSEAGFDEYFVGPGLRFVEWPAQAGDRLPEADWRLTLADAPEGGRVMAIDALSATGLAGAALLERLNR